MNVYLFSKNNFFIPFTIKSTDCAIDFNHTFIFVLDVRVYSNEHTASSLLIASEKADVEASISQSYRDWAKWKTKFLFQNNKMTSIFFATAKNNE